MATRSAKADARNYFGSMMVDQGMADAFISGISRIILAHYVQPYKL